VAQLNSVVHFSMNSLFQINNLARDLNPQTNLEEPNDLTRSQMSRDVERWCSFPVLHWNENCLLDSPSKSRTSYLSKTKFSTANRKPQKKAGSCSINVNVVGLKQYQARHKTKIGNSKEDSCNPLGVTSDCRCEHKTLLVIDLQSRQCRLVASNPRTSS
jgi:hypothetical protein